MLLFICHSDPKSLYKHFFIPDMNSGENTHLLTYFSLLPLLLSALRSYSVSHTLSFFFSADMFLYPSDCLNTYINGSTCKWHFKSISQTTGIFLNLGNERISLYSELIGKFGVHIGLATNLFFLSQNHRNCRSKSDVPVLLFFSTATIFFLVATETMMPAFSEDRMTCPTIHCSSFHSTVVNRK